VPGSLLPMMLRVIWLAAAVACSRPPPPAHTEPGHVAAVADAGAGPAIDAAPLDQDLPRLVERTIAMYQAIAQALATSGADCAAVTAKLGELAATHRDVVSANAKVLHDGRAEELKAALRPRGEAFDAAARAIMQSQAMSRCAKDAAFTRALDELLGAS
jgi:hypothetical protein